MGTTWKDMVLRHMQGNEKPSSPYNKGNRLIEVLKQGKPRDEQGRFTSPNAPKTDNAE